jgi:hypothetical protein
MKKGIFLLVIFGLLSFTLHDMHISLTKVNYKQEQKSVQITMRCFIDDIALAIDTQNEITSELDTDRELKNVDKYLKEYLVQNFYVSINNSVSKFNYLGKEYEDDIIYFYLEIENVDSIDTIEIKNSVLLQTFDDQQNLVKLKINSINKTFYLSNKNDKEMLKVG